MLSVMAYTNTHIYTRNTSFVSEIRFTLAMEDLKVSYKITFLIITFCLVFHGFSQQTDTINSTFTLRDPDAIASPGNVFKLGFFSPANTTNRYLAIYYAVSEQTEPTTVWVANRDSPLTDSSGRVSLSGDGNLVLSDGRGRTIWSTNLTAAAPANTTARLLNNGNLVLYDGAAGNSTRWESFSHPTDSWIPEMKVVDDTISGHRLLATSWKNATNPEIGGFTLGIQALKIPQVFTWKSDGSPHFRSGQFNGKIFIGMRGMYSSLYINRIAVEQLSPGIVFFKIPTENFLSRFTLNSSGTVEKKLWNDQKKSWDLSWAVPYTICDVYNTCGPFASCNSQGSPAICSCLKGFQPANASEWDRGNWTRGCVRRTQLECSRNNNTSGDDFFWMPFMKVPDFAEPFPSGRAEDCKAKCLGNCSCIAYAYDPNNIGCMFWSEGDGLVDMQQFPNVGYDLYVRLPKSELDRKGRDRKLAIILSVVGAFVAVSAVLIFTAWCCMVKKKGAVFEGNKLYEGKGAFSSDSSSANNMFLQDESSKVKIEDLPLYSFETLSNATNGFSEENVLGKGGFGVVYKGKLSNGKEIAVKRLSEASRQGKLEFTNEVVLISKLQHRNLVRLMGCCAEKEEKMLIYEYMPNKSLDVYLFGWPESSLDWKKRYNIIEGIGRGLLYLHRDSRLRIIHRDLKPSNVLLDDEWNPKISDFGMARIFQTNEEHANTARVVGTYGYMAPEYATEGRFSEKSDVYSFGVVLLEIISGKKNTQYYNHEWSLSLLGCAWKLWSEGNGMGFVDRIMADINPNFEEEEIVRCIHIGLLCVQESAYDRPTIQTVLSMLGREIEDLPFPQQPVFAEKWNRFGVSSTEPVGYSINQLTVTELDGR